MSLQLIVLLHGLAAVIGLIVAYLQMNHSPVLAWTMYAAALALTAPLYTGILLGLLPVPGLGALAAWLSILGYLLRWPAYGILVFGAVRYAVRRHKEQLRAAEEIRAPAVSPYGRSAYDTQPEPPPHPGQDRFPAESSDEENRTCDRQP